MKLIIEDFHIVGLINNDGRVCVGDELLSTVIQTKYWDKFQSINTILETKAEGYYGIYYPYRKMFKQFVLDEYNPNDENMYWDEGSVLFDLDHHFDKLKWRFQVGDRGRGMAIRV